MRKATRVLLTTIAIILLASRSYADTRVDLIARLMKAQGIEEMFEQQIRYTEEKGTEQARRILDQYLSSFTPNEEYRKKFTQAYLRYQSSLMNKWSAKDFTSVWSGYFGRDFTDSELSELVDFYESPLGRKERLAIRRAQPEFFDHFNALAQPIIDKATIDYIAELKDISKACRCSSKTQSEPDASAAGDPL